MERIITPIRPRQVPDLVFEQLRDLIFRGELKNGQKIPPERELASILKVSRTSVRKAITQLVTMGYLENRQGIGTFVRSPAAGTPPFDHAILSGKHSVGDLIEVRMGLECHIVGLAALRADDRDIDLLEKSYARLLTSPVNEASDADITFHIGIAYATHNQVHVELIRRFYDYLFYGIEKLHSLLYERKHQMVRIQEQHLNILEAIKRRDRDGAVSNMMKHIAVLKTFLDEQGAR